jgi:transposase
MLSVAPAPVIFMHTDATDMRKSFTGLCGIVRGVFGDDPADGSLFLFVNKRRDRIKALRWEGDGFVIWYKRLEVIGYDWQETLEVVPPKLVVRRTGIPKLACPKAPECGVVEAPRPVGLVEGNRYDTSVAAEVMVAKYAYHLPVYRQQNLFASCGWTPARSTLQNVLKHAANLIRPLVAHLREVVRASPIIGTDDTTVTLVVKDAPPPSDPDTPKNARAREVIAAAQADHRGSITARMWVYRSVTTPINVFDFTVSRHRDGPLLFLECFTGGLLADCYAGYDAVQAASDSRIVRAACVTHARRKVFEARSNHPVYASVLLAMFQELYDIEDRGKQLPPAGRLALRQAESRPIWERTRWFWCALTHLTRFITSTLADLALDQS